MDPKTAKCRKINLCEAEDQSFPRTDAVRPATASVLESQLANASRDAARLINIAAETAHKPAEP